MTEGKMFNCCLVIPLPMHDEDMYCVREWCGNKAQTSLTSHLQEYLTKRSAVKEKGVPLADVILQFEGVGTNDQSNLEYMKNKVPTRKRAHR